MRLFQFIISALMLMSLSATAQQKLLVYEGEEGPGKGKHIVFIASDHEYKAEETCPAMARLLAKRFGFKCTVLFGVNEKGEIKNGSNTIHGMETLKTADLMFVFIRFQDWKDEQMQHFVDYLDRAGPVIGLRTSTHGFKINQKGDSKWKKYCNFYKGEDYTGGFGTQVLGINWQGHYGGNHSSTTRIDLVEDKKSHPINKGVKNAWAYCGGYMARPPKDANVIAMAQPLKGLKREDPADTKKPPVPAAWTRMYEGKDGKKGRVFASTYGSSPDIENEGYRRMLINACFWAMGLEDKINGEADVSFVGPFNPTFARKAGRRRAPGVKPLDMAGWDTPIVPVNKK
jgi:hypothetical protein